MDGLKKGLVSFLSSFSAIRIGKFHRILVNVAQAPALEMILNKSLQTSRSAAVAHLLFPSLGPGSRAHLPTSRMFG